MRLVCFFILLLPFGLSAQKLSRQSLHCLGSSPSTSSLLLQQNVGQSSPVSVFFSDSLSLRQGFLQGLRSSYSAYISSEEWIVFPNPNNGTFTLTSKMTYTEPLALQVYNALGQQVCTLEHPASGVATFTLSLPSGLYILRAELPMKKSMHTRFILAP